MDRRRRHLDSAAEEPRGIGHHHEAALVAAARVRRGAVERGIDQPFRRLALLEAQPAGADVRKVEQEGRAGDLQIGSAITADKPLVRLRVVFDIGRIAPDAPMLSAIVRFLEL